MFSYFLEYDSLGVRGSSEGIGLPPGAEMSLLVVEIGPTLDTAILHVFSGGPDTCGFSHFGQLKKKKKPRAFSFILKGFQFYF